MSERDAIRAEMQSEHEVMEAHKRRAQELSTLFSNMHLKVAREQADDAEKKALAEYTKSMSPENSRSLQDAQARVAEVESEITHQAALQVAQPPPELFTQTSTYVKPVDEVSLDLMIHARNALKPASIPPPSPSVYRMRTLDTMREQRALNQFLAVTGRQSTHPAVLPRTKGRPLHKNGMNPYQRALFKLMQDLLWDLQNTRGGNLSSGQQLSLEKIGSEKEAIAGMVAAFPHEVKPVHDRLFGVLKRMADDKKARQEEEKDAATSGKPARRLVW